MSFEHCPDCRVPDSDQRCEAMTKPQPTGTKWQKEPHRCVRKAVQVEASILYVLTMLELGGSHIGMVRRQMRLSIAIPIVVVIYRRMVCIH